MCAALNVGNIVTVIARPDAFTGRPMARRVHETSSPGLQDTHGAGCHFRHRHVDADVRQGRRAFFASLPQNITPSTDDNPFFFLYGALGDLLSKPLSALSNNNAAISLTLPAHHDRALRLWVLRHHSVRPSGEADAAVNADATVTYFCAIGMGFMLMRYRRCSG